MAAASYAFVTEWTLEAPIDAVWAELHAPGQWPAWWRGVVSVEELESGGADGVGLYRRMTWKSVLPYELRFNMRTTRVERPSSAARRGVIEGRADGELCGAGVWTLTPTATGTYVRYDWTVEATTWWMRLLGPLARPAFEWNHDVVMRWGYEGLKRRIGATGTRRASGTSGTTGTTAT